MLYKGQKRPPDAPDRDPGGFGRVQEGGKGQSGPQTF